jgi:serine protease
VGNLGSESCVSPPATVPGVIGVGGSTEGGCLGEYSLGGEGVDLLAPGGGRPVRGCRSRLSQPIYQVTLRGSDKFGLPSKYVGTSMAAAHVSGVAAMVLAARVIGRRPPDTVPGQVLSRLQGTARDLGLPAAKQGAGLVDAAAATAPEAPARRP